MRCSYLYMEQAAIAKKQAGVIHAVIVHLAVVMVAAILAGVLFRIVIALVISPDAIPLLRQSEWLVQFAAIWYGAYYSSRFLVT
jgi:hypothetical protein